MLNLYPLFIIGAFGAGAIGSLLVPTDLIKTQLQVRDKFIKEKNYYSLDARKRYLKIIYYMVKDLKKDVNIRTIRIGAWPIFLLSGGSTMMRVASYQVAYSSEFISEEGTPLRAIMFCGLWGSIQQGISNPFIFMKTKLQYWSMCESSSNRPLMQTITLYKVGKILHQVYGWKIFITGLRASLYRGFMAAIAQTICFERVKNMLNPAHEMVTAEINFHIPVIAALAAGTFSTFIVSPFDVILTRMHTQPYMMGMRGLLYSGFWDCFWKILIFEGWHGLYKGGFFLWLRHGTMATFAMLFWNYWKDDFVGTFSQPDEDEEFTEELFDFCYNIMSLF